MTITPTKFLAFAAVAAAGAAASGTGGAGGAVDASQNPLTISCTDTSQVVEAPLTDGLKSAITAGRCGVQETASCADKTAVDVFRDATWCNFDPEHDSFSENGAFDNAEFKDVPAQTPSPAPDPAQAPVYDVIKVACNDTSRYRLEVGVTDPLADSLDEQICKLNPPNCLENGKLKNSPVKVAESSLSCPIPQQQTQYKQYILGNSTQFSPVEGADRSGDGNGNEVEDGGVPISSTPTNSGDDGSGNEVESALASASLTKAEIAYVLDVTENDQLVTTAQTQVKDCNRVDAVEYLTNARLNSEIDGLGSILRLGQRNLKNAISKINCDNRRDGSASKSSTNRGYENLRDSTYTVANGSSLSTALISFFVFGCAVLGVKGRSAYQSSRRSFAPNNDLEAVQNTNAAGSLVYPIEAYV